MTKGQSDILVRGAREHNLRDLDVDIPRGSLTTISGVSGSGKSSLAFDTIFKEGQRRFVESLSSYARQFLGQAEKPRVERIEGLSPTISIDQKTVARNPRSTVGTVTEVHDHLRLLFARLGTPRCPACGLDVAGQSVEQIVDRILADEAGQQIMVLAPIVKERKGEYRKELAELRAQGFVRARIDGTVVRLDEPIELARYERHTLEVVLDRVSADPERRSRIAEAVERGLDLGKGQVNVLAEERLVSFSSLRACPGCGMDVPELEPRLFSFNSPQGACPACDGLGTTADVDERLVVPDEELSIDAGAIVPSARGGWKLKQALRPEMLAAMCDGLEIPRGVPYRKLTARCRQLLMQGSGARCVPIRYVVTGKRRRFTREMHEPWEGVLPVIRRLYDRSPSRGLERFMAPGRCRACAGTRLRPAALAVRFRGRGIADLAALDVDGLLEFLRGVGLEGNEALIGKRLFKELEARLEFLSRVGVGYLTLDRSTATLAGGEAQRIRLATQVGSALRGILYVLDEPSIGLHQRDNRLLIETLKDLRDAGNTVLVVEHDQQTIEAADWVVDIGPGAGAEGGQLVAAGPPAVLWKSRDSITGAFLSGREVVPMPERRRAPGRPVLSVLGASEHNLKNVTIRIPLGLFTCVTGVSGSGKSTLIDNVLKRALARRFHGAEDPPGRHRRITGMQHLDKVIEIDQAPIGRTPRSNPATYTKVFDLIRDLFASLPESKARGYMKGRFSFNVKGGRCEDCAGAGLRLVEMQFLSAVEVPCDTCASMRFNPETLEIHYRGKSISDVLLMTVGEALEFFGNHPRIARVLAVLDRVGLGYMQLGQPSTTISGGEAQRVKLARFLHRPPTGRTLYLLDEPTTGLHFLDIKRLVGALQELVDQGNTVVVIEHNLDVVKCCDWIIDLGPEGGAGGGEVVYCGPFAGVLEVPESRTGEVLRDHLGATHRAPRRRKAAACDRSLHGDLTIRGARLHNLKNVDVDIPAGSLTVVTGPSGSGKTSLAFDTLFAEGQRRFVECLSTYARQFLGRMDRPPVDSIGGLAPAIAIDQKTASRNPRSTVATVTELHDHLRLLYARVGTPHCPACDREIRAEAPDVVVDALLAEQAGAQGRILAPLFVEGAGYHTLLPTARGLMTLAARLREEGFLRVLVDGAEQRLDGELPDLRQTREIWLVVDRVRVSPAGRTRLLDSVAQAYERGLGILAFEDAERGTRRYFSQHAGCAGCGIFMPGELTPRMFSFNSHQGACEACHGLGIALSADPDRLVADPELPLFSGALVDRPGDFISRRDSYLRKVVERLARDQRVDLEQPWQKLPKRFRDLVLEGSDEELDLEFKSRRGGRRSSWKVRTRWKGFLRYVEDWHATTESDWFREIVATVMREDICQGCGGERLKPLYRAVRVGGLTLGALGRLNVRDVREWVRGLAFRGAQARVAEQLLKELENRLGFLVAVGLDYIGLSRSAGTLSGGEAQRIRLATQIGNRLCGVIYVLDEPTIGLHPRDTDRLLGTLRELRDLGNTVVVVEHDRETIAAADWIVDLGPGAGHRGGEVVFQGRGEDLLAARTLTADYLAGRRRIPRPTERRTPTGRAVLRGVTTHNLRGIDVEIPLGILTVVTGVSGSGKSSLVMDTLAPAVEARLQRRPKVSGLAGATGLPAFSRLVIVDQQPIGSSPRSNPASYIGVLDEIRQIMSTAPLARMRGYDPGRFSFNKWEGRCAACDGRGSICVEMHFLPDVWVSCESCGGRRFNRQTLEIRYRGKSIADVLELEVSDAVAFFENHEKVARPLRVMEDVGLGYMKLGQSATTLSGGEAQRIKLARELGLRSGEHALYILDEPTTGLHFDDVARLVAVLHRLVEKGHTVVLIEHNMDVIASADQIIDLGPEGGDGGGLVLATGTPEEIAACGASWTGRHLAPVLGARDLAESASGFEREAS